MKRNGVLGIVGFIVALSLLMPTYATAASAYPERPIKMIVPLSAGTTTDIVARLFAKSLSNRLKQTVIVENKPGVGGSFAANLTAKSDPDGYTILLANSQFSINPAVYRKLPYDPVKDFAPIALVAEAPSGIIVPKQLGVQTVKQFIALAKKEPNTLNYASSGVGSQTHLAGAYFASQAGIDLVHVPYRNASAVVADILADRVQAVFVPPAFLLGPIKQGQLRLLAVTSRDGIEAPVKAPSVNETAIPGYEYDTWFGFLAPAKVPTAILKKLAENIREIAQEPDLKKRLAGLGIVTRSLSLDKFGTFLQADIRKEAKIVAIAGIKPH